MGEEYEPTHSFLKTEKCFSTEIIFSKEKKSMKIPPETFKACLAYFIIKVLKNTVISTHCGMVKTKEDPIL